MEIKDHPNYLIYPDGRVWSKKGKGRFMKFSSCRGYLSTNIDKVTVKPHRLVAEHYIPNPDNLPQVDHINRIRNDNRVENLRWVSLEQQNNNKKLLFSNNKTGHRKISLTPEGYYCVRTKINGKSISSRQFRNKIDAICYKYILLLKIKSSIII